MKFLKNIDEFFTSHYFSCSPFLLALSGGPDSMALFQCLVLFLKNNPFRYKFHIAHVDHGWRPESSEEASILQNLSNIHSIPFHLKRLNPDHLEGNLEAAFRSERYNFFKEICSNHHLSGVMTAHHQGDQAETILKRVLEGSYWTNLSGLQPVTHMEGLEIFRPFLQITKKEILDFLIEHNINYFNDSTNNDVQFLRARMRHQILPWLNESFGKDVNSALLHLGSEMRELSSHLDEQLQPFLLKCKKVDKAIHIELTEKMPHSYIVKALIRKLCEECHFIPSRQILAQATEALIKGDTHKKFLMGNNVININRKHISINLK